MLQDQLRVFLFPVFAYFTRNEGCIFSTFEHFDLNVTSGNKIFHLMTEGNVSTRRSGSRTALLAEQNWIGDAVLAPNANH